MQKMLPMAASAICLLLKPSESIRLSENDVGINISFEVNYTNNDEVENNNQEGSGTGGNMTEDNKTPGE